MIAGASCSALGWKRGWKQAPAATARNRPPNLAAKWLICSKFARQGGSGKAPGAAYKQEVARSSRAPPTPPEPAANSHFLITPETVEPSLRASAYGFMAPWPLQLVVSAFRAATPESVDRRPPHH